ncbi:MAG: Rrf2 family transcriptional regulator [Anaerolineae bacterium]|nr:Rrf2 family transcriptional regulator [Anaerolineae bacterium]
MTYSLGFTQTVYLVLYVADKVEQGMYEFIPTQQISADLNIPPASAASILRRLNRARIIETREGAAGGVRLARAAEDVTLLDLLVAIEQERPLFQTQFQLSVRGTKPTRAQIAIRDVLDDAEQAMKQHLSQITVKRLIGRINT